MDTPYLSRCRRLLAGRDPRTVLAALGDGLEAELVVKRPGRLEAPGEWSPADVVHHLADTELVHGYRLRVALTSDRPRFAPFEQDAWARRLGPRINTLDESRALLDLLRSVHLRLIDTLAPEELERAAVHDSRGDESVRDMLVLWAGHDLIHLDQLTRMRRSES